VHLFLSILATAVSVGYATLIDTFEIVTVYYRLSLTWYRKRTEPYFQYPYQIWCESVQKWPYGRL